MIVFLRDAVKVAEEDLEFEGQAGELQEDHQTLQPSFCSSSEIS